MKLASSEKIDFRKALYGGTALVGAIGVLAQAFHLVDAGTVDNINNLIQAILQFVPTAGVTTAAVILGRQAKVPGMLEPTPAALSPVEQVINGVQAAVQAKTEAAQRDADAGADLAKIHDVAKGVLGSLAEQVVNAVLPRA